jgi:hypothetical protein
MKALILTIFAILSMGRLVRPHHDKSTLEAIDATTCTPSKDPLDYTLLIYGIAEGIFTSLKMTNGQRCIGQAEKTQEWIKVLIEEVKGCIARDKGAQCYVDMTIKNLPTLMTVLAKLTTECPETLKDLEGIWDKVKEIFADFQGYSQRLILKLYGTIGNVVNDFMNAYYGICQTKLYKKAGVQLGEMIGIFLNI